MITRTGFYVEVEVRSSKPRCKGIPLVIVVVVVGIAVTALKIGEVVFESKAAEHSRNSNNVRLLRDAGSEAVVLEDLKLKIKVILFARVFDFIRIELS